MLQPKSCWTPWWHRCLFNSKLNFKNRISGFKLAEDVVDMSTGEIIAAAGDVVSQETALAIQNAAVPYVFTKMLSGRATPIAYDTCTSISRATPAATMFLAM